MHSGQLMQGLAAGHQPRLPVAPRASFESDGNRLILVLAGFTLRAASESIDQPFRQEEVGAVTKKDIVKTISEQIGMTQMKTKAIVDKTFEAIVQTLVEDGKIELRNFGVFKVKRRAARRARNPRTNETVHVPEKLVVTFKPGKEMEERVRQLDEERRKRLAAQSQSPAEPTGQAAPETLVPGEASPSAGASPDGPAPDVSPLPPGSM
ncbi:MAG: hypothetical protein KatS3mg110_3438 [Pirellulaceae bacterium]|nr:MAG: hypothetical protein KatS3mg110_3438 [Pirellulaceae bacterium]